MKLLKAFGMALLTSVFICAVVALDVIIVATVGDKYGLPGVAVVGGATIALALTVGFYLDS